MIIIGGTIVYILPDNGFFKICGCSKLLRLSDAGGCWRGRGWKEGDGGKMIELK